MIYEIRTYQLAVGSLAEVLKRVGESYERRKAHSPLAACWRTDIGPLNELVCVWPYADLAERARVQARAAQDPGWPPRIEEFIASEHCDVLVPFPFVPAPPPGKLGPIFEMRSYTLKPGALPALMERWERALPARVALSPLVLAGHVELGSVDRFVHVWAYGSFEQRTAVREKARETGVWPPPGGGDAVIAQTTKILLPARFSPLR